MDPDIRMSFDQLADSLETMKLLATRLRRQLGVSAQEAVDMEAAADKAVRAMKRLRLQGVKKR